VPAPGSSPGRTGLDDVPDDVLGDTFGPYGSCSFGSSGRAGHWRWEPCGPTVDRGLHPSWYVAGVPDEVDACPVILPSLIIADMEGNDLRTTQATTEEKRDVGGIALLVKSFLSGSGEECFTLLRRPTSCPRADRVEALPSHVGCQRRVQGCVDPHRPPRRSVDCFSFANG
jgi:hypothetical protein